VNDQGRLALGVVNPRLNAPKPTEILKKQGRKWIYKQRNILIFKGILDYFCSIKFVIGG
jgi:hypothetical protein